MKIFVFSTHANWQPHLETELEIIQDHLNKGDTVYRFVCNGDLPACDINNKHELALCLHCKQMSLSGKSLLEGSIIDLPLISSSPAVKAKLGALSFQYDSVKDFQGLYIDNLDVGLAALSSVISWLREPEPDVNLHRELIDHCLYSSAEVYFSALEYISRERPARIYAFNGRLVHVRPVLRAAQLTGTECLIHERGCDIDHYQLYRNTTPHDRAYTVSLMRELWENADPQKKVGIAESFYTERAAGKSQGWYSYTDKQEKGLLPEDWNDAKRNVVIFNSSEDEFASIGPEWKNDLYDSQLSAIPRIIRDCQKFSDVHFYLRVHPNLSNIMNSEIKTISQLSYPNLTVIKAESPISTYDLLFNCDKVLAFGSSVGIEAVYWGKPSIQAGKSYYFEMDATYKPSTHEELVEMIGATLQPMDRTPALIYGYYFKKFGIRYKYYQAQNLFTGSYKGHNIDAEVNASRTVFKTMKRVPGLKAIAQLMEEDYRKNKRKIFPFLMKRI